MPRWATGEMRFSIVYDAKAILRVEIGMETTRVSAYTPEGNEAAWVEELDLERRQCRPFIGWNNIRPKLAMLIINGLSLDLSK